MSGTMYARDSSRVDKWAGFDIPLLQLRLYQPNCVLDTRNRGVSTFVRQDTLHVPRVTYAANERVSPAFLPLREIILARPPCSRLYVRQSATHTSRSSNLIEGSLRIRETELRKDEGTANFETIYSAETNFETRNCIPDIASESLLSEESRALRVHLFDFKMECFQNSRTSQSSFVLRAATCLFGV